ncbi:MAG: cadherin-like domain-containing protein, partial [Actinomycetota bacterium]
MLRESAQRSRRVGLAGALLLTSLVVTTAIAPSTPVLAAVPNNNFDFPDRYSVFAPDCFGPTPAAGCDDFTDDKYERPFDEDDGDYFPALDITQIAIGQDSTFAYFTVAVAGSIGLDEDEKYAFELDIDAGAEAARPDILIYSTEPENLPAGVWGQSGIIAAEDSNDDVGGADPNTPGEGAGDGFDSPLTIGDDIWVRRIGNRIELAVEYGANGIAGLDPATVLFRAFSTTADPVASSFLVNDVFTSAQLTSIDTATGLSDRLSALPPAAGADLGGVADADATPQNTPISLNVLANDMLGANVVLDSINGPSKFGGIIVDNGGGNVTYIPVASFSGTDDFTYTLRDTVTGETQTVKVTILVDPVEIPPLQQAIENFQPVEISECGLAVLIDPSFNTPFPGVSPSTNPDGSTFRNIGYVPSGSGPPGSLDPGIHMSRQIFGAQDTDGGADGPGLGSSLTLIFTRPVTGLQLGFQAQQAEEEFTFSVPATSVTPTLNSTFGIAPAVISRVSLEDGNTKLVSDMTGTFGSNTTDSFGANSIVTWDWSSNPQDRITITHSGPINDPRNANTETVYNGTIVNEGPVNCTPLVDQIGTAKRAGDVTDNGDGSYTVTYTYEVENMGNTELTAVQVIDDFDAAGRFGTYTASTPTAPNTYTVSAPVVTFNVVDALQPNPAFTGEAAGENELFAPAGSLLPGETAEIAVDVTFVPDFSGGDTVTIQNQITATAEGPTANRTGITTTTTDDSTDGSDPDPNSDGVPDEESPTVITVTRAVPAIDVVKTLSSNADEDGSNTVSLGDTLTYEFLVTNSGDVELQDVAVADPLITDAPNSGTISCPQTTLAAGASTTCTGDYTVTQADVNNGQIENTAIASGDPDGPGGDPPVPSPPSDEDVPVPQEPEIDLVKSFVDFTDNDADPALTVGDDINYLFTITNTGNVTLTGVTIED